MWMLFLVFTIPLIDLATISLRTTFLVTATHDAAHMAARAKSFQTAYDANDPSAQQSAQNQVAQDLTKFPQIKTTSVLTNLVITNITTSATVRQKTPLAQPADTSSNTYTIEVVVTAQVNPLITFNSSLFGNIPGLSAPVTVACAAQEFAEYPQGLTQ